jgi:hypothetical protein
MPGIISWLRLQKPKAINQNKWVVALKKAPTLFFGVSLMKDKKTKREICSGKWGPKRVQYHADKKVIHSLIDNMMCVYRSVDKKSSDRKVMAIKAQVKQLKISGSSETYLSNLRTLSRRLESELSGRKVRGLDFSVIEYQLYLCAFNGCRLEVGDGLLLSFEVPPVELVELCDSSDRGIVGPFIAMLEVERCLKNGSSDSYLRLYRGNDQTPCSPDGFIHPHCSTGSIFCIGEYLGPLRKLIERGRVFDAMQLSLSLIRGYRKRSAWAGLQKIVKLPEHNCSVCGSIIKSRNPIRCQSCNERICGDCSIRCEKCGTITCDDCRHEKGVCEFCGKTVYSCDGYYVRISQGDDYSGFAHSECAYKCHVCKTYFKADKESLDNNICPVCGRATCPTCRGRDGRCKKCIKSGRKLIVTRIEDRPDNDGSPIDAADMGLPVGSTNTIPEPTEENLVTFSEMMSMNVPESFSTGFNPYISPTVPSLLSWVSDPSNRHPVGIPPYAIGIDTGSPDNENTSHTENDTNG